MPKASPWEKPPGVLIPKAFGTPDPRFSLFQERAVFLIRQLADEARTQSKDLPHSITGFVNVAPLKGIAYNLETLRRAQGDSR